jgi:hypothetical protein
MTDSGDTLLLEVLKEIRSEMRDHRALLLESIDQGRTLERHVDAQLLALNQSVKELKDDLELVIKSELMGLVGGLANGGSHGQEGWMVSQWR